MKQACAAGIENFKANFAGKLIIEGVSKSAKGGHQERVKCLSGYYLSLKKLRFYGQI